MKEFDYVGRSFYLSDRLASSLLDYAAALAAHGKADTVQLGAYDTDGKPVELALLVGPASQILMRSVDGSLPERDNDAAMIEELSRRTALLQPSRPIAEPLDEDDLNML